MTKIGKVSDNNKLKCDFHKLLIVFYLAIEIMDECMQTLYNLNILHKTYERIRDLLEDNSSV